ncbi:unnamed protein product [Thelazia callipaeda]|uniref:ELM2 domain-containing protein n=1 Tax=Thelazia callipaeda TaxID=103827 RepID=A0A0N5D4S1_THECL|nr:unnamed protein product [Thelazia callipaeda]
MECDEPLTSINPASNLNLELLEQDISDDDYQGNIGGEKSNGQDNMLMSSTSVQDEPQKSNPNLHFSSTSNGDYLPFNLPKNLEIREGMDYQCPVGDWMPDDFFEDEIEREICIWRPTNAVSDSDLKDYLSIALSQYSIDQERAMFILQTLGFNIIEAKNQLAKRRIRKEGWTSQDVAFFKKSLLTCGKDFKKFKHWLPHKSLKEIISFYYDKKNKLGFRRLIDTFVQENNPEHSRLTDDQDLISNNGSSLCSNCEQTSFLRQVEDLMLCNSCYIYFRNYHLHRPRMKSKRCGQNALENIDCPPGMVEIVERFIQFANRSDDVPESLPMNEATDDSDIQIVNQSEKGCFRIEKHVLYILVSNSLEFI